MQITRQADYAVRAVRYLAQHYEDTRISTSTVAKVMKIPPSFLAKIISQLSIKGLLHTARGANGGIGLAHRPEEISLLDVVEAIDGPIAINECVLNPDNCEFSDECPVHDVWSDVHQDIIKRLRTITFDQLK